MQAATLVFQCSIAMSSEEIVNYRVSVDCVVFGFDGSKLNVLLIKMLGKDENLHNLKLPGGIIRKDEDLDEAARRVLDYYTGLTSLDLIPFRAFGSPDRIKNPLDVKWVEQLEKLEIIRAVTAAFVGLVRLDSDTKVRSGFEARWVPVSEVPELAFDHNEIINQSLPFIRMMGMADPSKLSHLLPEKFTASQLLALYNEIFGKKVVIRNFYKKIHALPGVVQLEEKQKGVSHRAATYYKFDLGRR